MDSYVYTVRIRFLDTEWPDSGIIIESICFTYPPKQEDVVRVLEGKQSSDHWEKCLEVLNATSSFPSVDQHGRAAKFGPIRVSKDKLHTMEG